MKKVYEGLDLLLVGHLKNILESEGIESVTKNDYLAGARGEIPVTECWYEIWVEDDLRYDDARKIIDGALSEDIPSGPAWICPKCHEENEFQFSECWNCGTERPLRNSK